MKPRLEFKIERKPWVPKFEAFDCKICKSHCADSELVYSPEPYPPICWSCARDFAFGRGVRWGGSNVYQMMELTPLIGIFNAFKEEIENGKIKRAA